jgi:hypothetical protein
MLGLLWPLLKAGVIGLLTAVKGRDAHTKIEVSNKLAKIISGGSSMFLIGFVKGLLKGVWDVTPPPAASAFGRGGLISLRACAPSAAAD